MAIDGCQVNTTRFSPRVETIADGNDVVPISTHADSAVWWEFGEERSESVVEGTALQCCVRAMDIDEGVCNTRCETESEGNEAITLWKCLELENSMIFWMYEDSKV